MTKKTSFRIVWAIIFLTSFILIFQCASGRGVFGGGTVAVQVVNPALLLPDYDPNDAVVKLGIDVLVEKHLDVLKGKNVGLITNQSGVNRQLESTVDVLFWQPDIIITGLFAPEHGIRGDIPAGQPVAQYTDPYTGLPVHSLYGNTKKPTLEMLANIDILVFDIQDVGVRPYTYIYTMALSMAAARDAGIPFIVLDRPNPLGGNLVDGNILHPDFKSFIGMYPIPYVHGMTAGELAWYFNREFAIGVNLQVIPMEGWERWMRFKDTGLQWIPTSPHIPSAETPPYYATTGSIGELGTISVGVGYTMPFKIVGAPWIDAQNLALTLNSRNLPGITFRPAYWQQFYGIFTGQQLGGVELVIFDHDVYSPFSTGLHILEAIHTLYPDKEIFDENRVASFNRATGTDTILRRLQSGLPASFIIDSYQFEIEEFKKKRREYLLY